MTVNPRPWRRGPIDTVPETVPFRCEVLFVGDRAIVSVRGEIDLQNAPGLLNEVIQTLEGPVSHLTIDLGRVTFVDSSGIATLVAAQHRARQRDITFELASVPDQARRIFKMTDLAEMFGLDD